MESLIIGIAGGSGSGKSTFTNRIKKRFGDDVVVLYHDNYYRRQDGIPFEQQESWKDSGSRKGRKHDRKN